MADTEEATVLEDFNDSLTIGGRKRRRLCGFSKWMEALSAEDRVIAGNLAADRRYRCRELLEYFSKKGAEFSYQVLNRHRNGYCCGQEPRQADEDT